MVHLPEFLPVFIGEQGRISSLGAIPQWNSSCL
ncbi:hypothetical protein F0726_02585 [Acidithiobacillus caldus]|nr:hypothetical protein F0726_02585 [Acidithiobacillus caldus]